MSVAAYVCSHSREACSPTPPPPLVPAAATPSSAPSPSCATVRGVGCNWVTTMRRTPDVPALTLNQP
eukprot:364473-Chlamydomonas_euryale.AAC.8